MTTLPRENKAGIPDFRENALSTVRLLAALSVLYGHGIAHLQLEQVPLLGPFLRFFTGVPLFFALSGYLLWQSAGREAHFFAYARRRFRRIYPELWLAVAVELAVLLLLFSGPIRWGQLGLFALTQGTVLQFWTPDFLRGYGCGTPNGSLWTICTLIQFYVLLYFLRKWLHGKKLWVWLMFLGGSILLGVSDPVAERLLPGLLFKLYRQTVIPYLWLFALGMLLSEKQATVLPFLRRWWWVFGILALGARLLTWDIACGYYGLIGSYTLLAAVLGIAYRFPRLGVKKDISYGIYLYHMTVINAMIALGFTGKTEHLFFAMGASCLLAWGSAELFQRGSTANKRK